MSMSFSANYAPAVFPVTVGGETGSGGGGANYSELITMDNFTISFPDGASSNLDGTEVQVFPGEAVRVSVPEAAKSGLHRVWAKVRKGGTPPDSNDFFCIALKVGTDAEDWAAYGSAASVRFVSIAKVVDTAGSLDTATAPTQSSWTASGVDAASPWYQVAQVTPAYVNFRYGGACYGPDAVATSAPYRETTEPTDTLFRTTLAAPSVDEVVLVFDPTQAPAANSYFVVESMAFESRPEVYNGSVTVNF